MDNPASTLLANAANQPAPIPEKKQQEVLAAFEAKKASFQKTVIARATGKGSEGLYGREWDLQNLSPAQLEFKYGPVEGREMNLGILQGSNQNLLDAQIASGRTKPQVAWDTTTGVLSGAVSSLAGLGALGLGAVSDDAGTWASEKIRQGQEWVEEDVQSDGLGAIRRRQRMESSLDKSDNLAQMRAEDAAGANEFVSGLRRWGRDVIDTVSNSADPEMFAQGTADAVGSLLAGGPLAKGLKAVGSAALNAAGKARVLNPTGAASIRRATEAGDKFDDLTFPIARANIDNPSLIGAVGTNRAIDAGSWATWPTAIAGLEAGGAYSGTVSDVMEMSHEQLMQASEPYRQLIAANVDPEQAKIELASKAGNQAALTQGAVGFASGGLSRWAETPFKVPSFRSGLTNIAVKEPLEEALQGGTGALSQNYAVRKHADDTRTLSEGAGEQTALGALYGFGASGAVQGPGLVASAPGAAWDATKNAMVGLGKYVDKKLEAAEEKADKESPVGREVMQAASTQLRSKAQEIVGNLRLAVEAAEDATPEQRAAEMGYVEAMAKALDLSADEVQREIPPALQTVIADAPDRFAAMQLMGKHVTQLGKSAAGSAEHVQAIAAFSRLLEPFMSVQNPDFQILGKSGAKNVDVGFQNLRQFIAKSTNTLINQRVLRDLADKELINPDQVSDAAIETPQGQEAAKQAAAIAVLAPGTGSLQTAELVLKHAENGKITLTPAQKRAVHATKLLLAAQKQLVDAKDIQPRDVVNDEVVRKDAKDPLSGKVDNPYRLSAAAHVNQVLKASLSGNQAQALEYLDSFGKFAQHMQNKLDAFNRSYESGGKPQAFLGITPDKERLWYPTDEYIFVNMKTPHSIELAQKVAVEASVLADVYNGLVEAMPELGLEKVEKVSLDQRIAGKVEQKKEASKQDKKPADTNKTDRTAEDKAAQKTPVKDVASILSTGTAISVEQWADGGTVGLQAVYRDGLGKERLLTVEVGQKKLDVTVSNPRNTRGEFAGTAPLNSDQKQAVVEKIIGKGAWNYLSNLIPQAAAIEKAGRELGEGFDFLEAELKKFEKNVDVATQEKEAAKKKAAAEEAAADRQEAKRAETAAAAQAKKEQVVETINVWAGSNENTELSNLASRPFEINGRKYLSVEHAYQSLKSGEFDQTTYDKYTVAGKKIAGNKGTKTENNWNIKLMRRLMLASFEQNPEAAKVLLATGTKKITHTQDKGVWAKEFPKALEYVRDQLKKPTATPAAATPPLAEEDKARGFALNEGQKTALASVKAFIADKAKTAFTLIGAAGTGKTTIVNEMLAALPKGRFDSVVLSSPTHRANAVTRSKNPTANIMTLHKLLGLKPSMDLEKWDAKNVKFEEGGDKGIPPNTLIIMDESSMISDGLYDFLMDEVKRSKGTKIVFLGDAAQLAPVKQTSQSKALTQVTDKAELTEVMRAKNTELLDESVAVRETGEFTYTQNMGGKGSGVFFLANPNRFVDLAVKLFKSDAFQKNPLLGRVVAFTNAKVEQYNKAIRNQLFPGAVDLVVDDLLMGYNAFGPADDLTGLTTIANGVDYKVTKIEAPKMRSVLGVQVPVQKVTIKDVLGLQEAKSIDVIALSITRDQRKDLEERLGEIHSKAWRRGSMEELMLEQFNQQYVLSFDAKYHNEKWDRETTSVKKTFDFGYAHTIHKSQGGTYEYVLVDDVNISTNPTKSDRNRLRYVGLTRAKHGAYVLTNREITPQAEKSAATPAPNVTPVVAPVPTNTTPIDPPLENLPPTTTVEETVAVAQSEPEERVEVERTSEPTLAADSTVAGRFPNLAVSGTGFNLTTAMVSAEGSRLSEVDNPVILVQDALTTQEGLEETTGKESKHALTPEIAKGYNKLLSGGDSKNLQNIGGVVRAMNSRLAAFLGKGKEAKTNLDRLKAGEKVNGWRNGKAINIVNLIDGKYKYDQNLVQSAALAGMQWLLGSHPLGQKTEEDYEGITGRSSMELESDILELIDNSMSTEDVKFALAAKIRAYWGLKPNSNIPMGFAEGISEAVAAEVMSGLIDVDFLRTETLTVPSREEGGKPKSFTRYWVNYDVIPDAITAFPSAIDEVALVESEPVRYIDGDMPPIPRTQMNNPSVENTREQRSTLKRGSEQIHRVNMPMVNVFYALNKEGLVKLFGKIKPEWAVLDEKEYDPDHRKAVEGRIRGIENAYTEVMATVSEVANRAEKAGKALKDMAIRYGYNMSKVGRMQMLGAYNSQSNKLTREAILPTWSTLNLLENSDHRQAFYLAMAQHLGVKVHKQAPAKSISDVQAALNSTYAPVLEYLQEWVREVDLNGLPNENMEALDADRILELLNGETLEYAGLHSLIEYARFLEADKEGLKNFETALYLEADGVTNGPVMAIMMMTSGQFDHHWLNTVRKGGVNVGGRVAMHELFAQDQSDLYTTATVNMEKPLQKLLRQVKSQKNRKYVMENISALNVVMGALFGKDAKYDPATRTITFDRGIAKNPLTITMYGSSAEGIAGNFANRILDAINEVETDIAAVLKANPELDRADVMFDGDRAKWNEYVKAINTLTSTALFKYDGKINRGEITSSDKDADFKALRDNFLHGFVEPMVESIKDTVGERLMDNLRILRQATQVQSIYLEAAYKQEVENLLVEKEKTDPNFKRQDFLSKKDFSEIDKRMAVRFPHIQTSGQVFRIAKSQRAFNETTEYSRGLDDSHRTGANTYLPTNAGVSGIASLVIGFGDGYMIQVAVNDSKMGNNLFVFDGINMPLDQLQTQGEAANRAAYQAFLQNPMKAVERSYRLFLDQLGDSSVSEKMLKDLARAFQEEGQPAMKPEDIAPVLTKRMEDLARDLASASASIDARHAAMEEVAVSVDHMASANAPYTNGVPAQDMTDDQILALLNERYQYHLGNPAPKINPDLVVNVTQKSGVQVIGSDYIRNLSKELKVDGEQAAMIREITDTLAAKDTVIIIGSLEEIAEYRTKRGLGMENFGLNDNGVYVPGENRIYLINATAETLTHELIHAATFNTLLAYYQDGTDNPVLKGAIERLEAMMESFLTMEADWTTDFELAEALLNAQNAVEAHLSKDDAQSKAAALNEFMAWTLANKELTSELKKPHYNNLVVQWAADVIKAIRELLWWKKYRNVRADFLSNLQFNTSIVIRSPQTPREMFTDITLYHSNTARADLKILRQQFSDLIISQINPTGVLDRERVLNNVTLKLEKTHELAKRAAVAFRLNTLEEDTLKHIVAAMATEAQLNSDVLARMQTLYTHVQKNLSPKSFMKKDSVDSQASHWAQEKFDLLMGKVGRLTDEQGRTSLLPLYFALSVVSGEFRDVLAGMTPPKTEKGDGTLDGKLRSVANSALESLSSRLSGDKNSPTVKAAMDALADRLSESLVDQKTHIERIESGMDKASLSANRWLVSQMTAVSDKGMELGRKLTQSNNKFQKSAGHFLKMTAAIASEKNAEEASEGWLATAERLNLGSAWMRLVTDVIGRTDSTSNVYDLIKPMRALVQQVRQQFRDSVPKIISEAFKKAPTAEQYATMFRAMGKTDMAALIGSMSKADILKLYGNQKAIDQKIKDLESQLQSMDARHFPLLRRKSQQLANYMNTGVTGISLLRNANAVAHLWNESTSSTRKPPTAEMISTVDQLISLYAMNGQPDRDKKIMAQLVQSEPEGMNFVLSYLEGQRKTEMTKAMQGKAAANHYKGYMVSLPRKEGHVIVANDADFVSLKQRGYVQVRPYRGSSLLNFGESRSYYYSDLPARAAFSQGLMQNVDQTAYGVDPVSGFSRDMTAGRIVSRRLVAQLSQNMKAETSDTEGLMPIFNEKGRIIAFEQSIDPRELARLEKSEQLHEMLGVWRGRQVEEQMSVEQNKVLIDAVHADWERDKNHTPELYVNLFDPKVLDAVQRDAVSLFSDEAAKYIQEKFGEGVFMVRKSLLEDVTGYRNASITDFWTNINRFDEKTNKAVREVITAMAGAKGYRMLVKGEQIIQGAVSDVRTLIVVKSMVVPGMNMLANIYQLISRGVNVIQIAKDAPSVVSQLNAYMESKLEQIRLEAQLRAAGDDTTLATRLEAKIRSIEDSHRRLEIWPLIEAGEFSTVADVGMTRDDLQLTSGRMDEWLGKQIDKLPPSLQTAARYGLVTKDTALFQGLQKSVQYGDFVAKQILFNHLTKKEGLTKEQALARITEEFVNYDRLPGRFRGGLENMGLLWFYNFKLRTIKIGLSTIRNNPLHALMMTMLPVPSGVGTPIDENLLARALDGGLGYTIGPEMLLRAPFMNPWVNLLD